MKPSAIMLLMVLPTVPGVYAADCATSFDQSCLSGGYNAEEVAADQKDTEDRLEMFQQQKEKQAVLDAKEEAKQAAEDIKEQRHQEQLQAQQRIEDAIHSQPPPEVTVNVPAPTVTVNTPPPVIIIP